MGRRLGRIGLLAVILGGMALGCTKAAVQHKEPPDPLLVTKKPVEGRPRRADADPAFDAPPPPPPPDREPNSLQRSQRRHSAPPRGGYGPVSGVTNTLWLSWPVTRALPSGVKATQ